MPRAKNVLWIMCDQLRHDYLGCTGHPTLKTPNIDALAAQLQKEGAASFVKSWNDLMEVITSKSATLTTSA